MMKNTKKTDPEKEIIKKNRGQIIFDLKRAFLQFITLTLISRGSKYAYEIKAEILRLSMGGFDIDRNNLYKKLRSLEKDGILKSHKEPSTRGAQRKYYTITPLGQLLLKKNRDILFPLTKAFREHIIPRR
ncbi:MAG: PadR family transcriptional regulator [Deltaproteobacteria bacterium]|nr:PadR family transcriptional regulator [Deltaproteobacteria bacterium]